MQVREAKVLPVKGRVRVVIRDAAGRVKVDETHKNLVVTSGRNHIADQMSAKNQAAISHMAVGTSSQAPAAGDTALIAELARVGLDSKAQGTGSDAHKVFYEATFPAGTATGDLCEAGMFNQASGGTMLCRSTFASKNKSATDVMTLYWSLIFTG